LEIDQNKVTKHFSVSNTFRQATMHAQIFCICEKKKQNGKTLRSLLE